jgi:hypothetical protein
MLPGGIRTRNLRMRVAANLSLRSRGHWDGHMCAILYGIILAVQN